MKKIIALLFTIAIMMPSYGFSEERAELSPPEEMSQVMQCMGVDLTISHLYLQIAASMIALSAPQSQTMKPLIKSYITLSQDAEHKTEILADAAQQVFIPQLVAHGQTKEEIAEISGKLLSQTLADIYKNVANPGTKIDDNIAMIRALIAKSEQCDNHFQKILDNHTL